MLKENLTKYRTQKGLSKLQLSAMSRVSRVTIANIEEGKENVSTTTLEKLAKALNITIQDLMK